MVCRQCGGAAVGNTRCMRCQTAAPAAVRSKKRAVLVGIQYTGANQLKGTINDIRHMKSLLHEEYKFPLNSIRILTDYNQRDPKMMPEKENILREMRWLVRDCTAGDSLVFYFSGHGGHIKDKDGDEADGWDEVLYALHNKYIVDDEINKTIVHPLKAGVMLHAIIDACHSGTVLDLPKTWNGRRWITTSRKGAKKGTSGGQAIMISGCTDRQFSSQTTNNFGSPTGDMTSAFYATVMDRPRTGPFTYGSLFASVKEMVLDGSEGKQTPLLSSSFDFRIDQKPFTL